MAKKIKKPINDINRKVFFGDEEFESLDIKTKNFIKELLYISWTDYVSSVILHDKKLYPQSIYLLQQSIEKATKACALKEKVIDLKKLRKKVGHNTYLFVEMEREILCKKLGKKYEKGDQRKVEIGRILFALMGKDYISKYLDKVKNNIAKIPGGKTIVPASYFFDSKSKRKKYISILPELSAISRIVSLHSNISRYPNKFVNPSRYDMKLGIVAGFDYLLEKIRKILILIDPEMGKELIGAGTFD